MSVFDRFENAVERGISGAFSKVFRSQLKPVDISAAVRRSMEDNTAAISSNRTVVPNEFTVSLSKADFDNIAGSDGDVLAEEMVNDATQYATEQSYSFVGPVVVTFTRDSTQETGTVRVTPATRRGPAAPVTSNQASPSHPILEIDGKRWMLTEPVIIIGRGTEADIVLADSGVSRKHLELRITPTGVIATDLGSTNGSYVEGHRIDAATLLDGNELTVGRTHIFFFTSEDQEA